MLGLNQRRSMVVLAALYLGCLIAPGCTRRCWCWLHYTYCDPKKKQKMFFDHAAFYDSKGNFKEAAARQAYLDFMKWKGYELDKDFEKNIQDNLVVTDFGLGQFTKVGMGMLIWSNDSENNYASVEVLLLPWQMMPEHWYVPAADAPPRVKTIHCRYGSAYLYGEGKPTKKIKGRLHEIQKLHTSVWTEQTLNVGEMTSYPKPAEKRWKQAGPAGAIFSEYSTYRTYKSIRFSDPNIRFKY